MKRESNSRFYRVRQTVLKLVLKKMKFRLLKICKGNESKTISFPFKEKYSSTIVLKIDFFAG
jgi:hypothetical protein